jgi:hypothetical protein
VAAIGTILGLIVAGTDRPFERALEPNCVDGAHQTCSNRLPSDTSEAVQEERSEQVMTRMTPSEVAMLEELAAADGIYRTDVLRLLVRREHAKRLGKGKFEK